MDPGIQILDIKLNFKGSINYYTAGKGYLSGGTELLLQMYSSCVVNRKLVLYYTYIINATL